MRTRFVLVTLLSFLPSVSDAHGAQPKDAPPAAAAQVTSHSDGLHGYIGFSAERPPARSEYSAGMGFYSAIWPLIDRPLANFQIGLAGSWIMPDNSDNKDQPLAPEARWPGHGKNAGRRGPMCFKP